MNKPTWQQRLRQILSTPGTVGFQAGSGCARLLQVLGLVFPLFTMVLIDTILPAQDVSMLTMLGLGMRYSSLPRWSWVICAAQWR